MSRTSSSSDSTSRRPVSGRFTRRRVSISLAGAAIAMCLLVVAPSLTVESAFEGRVFEDPTRVPTAPVAIVFGAGVWANGEPSLMLADRIDAAVELFRLGKVSRILMTGDNGRVDYDEVTVMKRYAVGRGVPADLVNLDYAGFRTYDSCYRAKAIFGVTKAILVTQGYHLPRALYLANSFGIDAVGLKAGRDSYPRQDYYDLREWAARLATWYEVNVTHPLPRYLGDPIDLDTQNL